MKEAALRAAYTGGRRFALAPCVDSFMDGCVAVAVAVAVFSVCTIHIFPVCTIHIFQIFTSGNASLWGRSGSLFRTFVRLFSDFFGVASGVFP